MCTFANSEEFQSSEGLDHRDYKQKKIESNLNCLIFSLTFHISSGLQSKNREHFCIFLMESKLMDLAIIMTKDMSARKCKCNELGPCVFCAPLDRYIGRHIDRHIGQVSVDISTDARSICQPTLGRYIGRDVSVDILTDISTEISADISADPRPICRSICRPRVVVRQSADMSIDRLPTFRRYLTATCVHSTGDCSLSRRHNLTLVSDFC